MRDILVDIIILIVLVIFIPIFLIGAFFTLLIQLYDFIINKLNRRR